MEQKLRDEARALLDQGKVDYIAGFAGGSLKFATTPLITKDKEALDNLVINPFIANNLAGFLVGLKSKVGVVAKGCDSRSIVSLIQDRKLNREDVVIIGVPCQGIVDIAKVEKLAGIDRDKIDDISRNGDNVTLTLGGKKTEYPVAQVLYDNCLACEFPTPQDYDILLGEPTKPVGEKETSQAAIEALQRCANLVIETSCMQGFEALRRMVDAVGAERVLFGTGAVLHYPACSVAKLEHAKISDSQRAAVASENATRLLHLSH
jgi:hypothetical protein